MSAASRPREAAYRIEVVDDRDVETVWTSRSEPDLAHCQDLARASGPGSRWVARGPDGDVIASGVVPDRQVAMFGVLDAFVVQLELDHGARRLRDLARARGVDVAMSTLALRFPVLQDKPGIRPWDPEIVDAWVREGAASSSALHAARFVLSVWNGADASHAGDVAELLARKPRYGGNKSEAHALAALRAEWRYPFLATEAWSSWDDHQRAAALSWLVDPWWP